MNEIKIFNSPEFGAIRVLEINGEPWLVLKDVCDVMKELMHQRSERTGITMDKVLNEIEKVTFTETDISGKGK